MIEFTSSSPSWALILMRFLFNPLLIAQLQVTQPTNKPLTTSGERSTHPCHHFAGGGNY